MSELLVSFKNESNDLILELEGLLDELEDNFHEREKLNEFSQLIDRIMGSAQSLSSFGFEQDEIVKLGSFAELCKQVGYRGANLENEDFYDVTIAFLFDAIDSMKKLLTSVGSQKQIKSISELLVSTFISRLKWILEQFEKQGVLETNYLASEKEKVFKSQAEIDDLLNSLGV